MAFCLSSAGASRSPQVLPNAIAPTSSAACPHFQISCKEVLMNNASSARTNGKIGQEYKIASSRFATGVTITTALRPDGSPVGLTVSSFTSLSLDPPLILVSIHRDCRALADLRTDGFFGVNILAAHQQSLSLRFASEIKE